MVVVFPEPLGPRNPCTPPDSTTRSRPSRAFWGGRPRLRYAFDTDTSSTAGIPPPALGWATLAQQSPRKGRSRRRVGTEPARNGIGVRLSARAATALPVGVELVIVVVVADDALHAGGEHAPLDQPGGEFVGAHVVDDRQRLEVLGADR